MIFDNFSIFKRKTEEKEIKWRRTPEPFDVVESKIFDLAVELMRTDFGIQEYMDGHQYNTFSNKKFRINIRFYSGNNVYSRYPDGFQVAVKNLKSDNDLDFYREIPVDLKFDVEKLNRERNERILRRGSAERKIEQDKTNIKILKVLGDLVDETR